MASIKELEKVYKYSDYELDTYIEHQRFIALITQYFFVTFALFGVVLGEIVIVIVSLTTSLLFCLCVLFYPEKKLKSEIEEYRKLKGKK